jgi:wobble nucleotide-excising tRNase
LPNRAKDDFNDFSTHHHSNFTVVQSTRVSEPIENSQQSPSEREWIVGAQELAGNVEKND